MPSPPFRAALCAVGALMSLLVTCSPEVPSPTAPPATVRPTDPPPSTPVAKPTVDERRLADFYRGKTVRMIVGFAPEGGYDAYSRLIAKYLGKYIPGNPSIVVEHMTGAGSMVAANHVYKVAPKDGTVIGNIGGPIVLEQMLGTRGVEFDLARFQFLGVPVSETPVLQVARRSGVSQFSDIVGSGGREVVLGGIPGSTADHAPMLLRGALGARVKLASGYEGTARLRLAMANGQVDGFVGSWQSTRLTNLKDVHEGNWLVLAQLTDEPRRDLPVSPPTIPELTTDEETRQLLLAGITLPARFAKLYVVAPEVPLERVAILDRAFQRAMVDPELLAEADRSRLEIDPLSGQETKRLVDGTLAMPPGLKSRLQHVIKPVAG